MSVKFNFVYLEQDAIGSGTPQKKKVGFILEIGTIVIHVELKQKLDATEKVLVERKKRSVTLGWDGHPTTTDGVHVLPRKAEMIMYGHYYPNGVGSWPIDPDTGIPLDLDNDILNDKNQAK